MKSMIVETNSAYDVDTEFQILSDSGVDSNLEQITMIIISTIRLRIK
jgi:hypothetical protein